MVMPAIIYVDWQIRSPYGMIPMEVIWVGTIEEIILDNPVIAAVSDTSSLERALKSQVGVIFILGASINTIIDLIRVSHQRAKIVMVHVDLMKGLQADEEGLKFLIEVAKADGIISTKAQVLRKAKELGSYTVQRIFVLDSKSIEMGIKQSQEIKPDLIEIMPGALVKAIQRMASKTRIPLIAGGLIDSEAEVMAIMKAGAVSVSTSNESLWQL